jgi:hypothetical protein
MRKAEAGAAAGAGAGAGLILVARLGVANVALFTHIEPMATFFKAVPPTRHSRRSILISIGNISASACCPMGCADFLRRRHRFERGAAKAAQSARTAAQSFSRLGLCDDDESSHD